MAEKVYFYITPESSMSSGRGVDIETQFEGLHYLQCKGLEDKGKAKNKYQESFADSDTLRVYEPDSIDELCLEPTDLQSFNNSRMVTQNFRNFFSVF